MVRKTKYKPEFDEQVYKLCLLGLTDAELGVFFEVSESTIHKWKKKHKVFGLNLRRGKNVADSEVAYSLYRRAVGDEKHFPSASACIFWLKNRRPDRWRNKPEDFVPQTNTETKELYLEALRKLAAKGF